MDTFVSLHASGMFAFIQIPLQNTLLVSGENLGTLRQLEFKGTLKTVELNVAFVRTYVCLFVQYVKSREK